MMVIQIIAGLALLLIGGEALVRGAVALGRWLGLSPLVVGILIVGIATSMPELVVSVEAVLTGSPQIAIGNVLGSNISNIMFVLAATALVLPIARQPRALRLDGPLMMAAAFLFVLLGLSGKITPWQGVLMLTTLIGFMTWEFVRTRRSTRLARQLEHEMAEISTVPSFLDHPAVAAALVLAGLAGLVQGGDLFLEGSTAAAAFFGVSKGVIGLTLVALGTSAPELASSLVAARRGHPDVAYGNIVGSNIINVLGVGGAAALAGGLVFPPLMARLDGSVMIAATAAMIWFLSTGKGLTRPRAAILFAGYVFYIIVRATFITG